MLAPLPARYRHLVFVTVLVTGMALGAWVAQLASVSSMVGTGVLVGAAAGLLAAYALVHDFSDPGSGGVHTRR
jgi:hypothetical protein